ncbi:phosphoethanolamine transferase [Pigmentiphaga aceris]|nr:phosphoethanolamine transferase [Pigmentiphaga aceris]
MTFSLYAKDGSGPPRADRQTRWLMAVALMAITTVFIVNGHDGRRLLQMCALVLPVVAWQLWPVRHVAWRTLRALVTWLVTVSFVIDGAVRAYISNTYQAAPDGSMVLGAIANTSRSESAEYLQMYWQQCLTSAIAVLVAVVLLGVCVRLGARPPAASSADRMAMGKGGRRVLGAALAACLMVSALGYISKPWRRLHPMVFWPAWSESVAGVRASWHHQETARQYALNDAIAAKPTLGNNDPATVVLVISESINRDNLGVYGYARATSPAMAAQKQVLADQLLKMRNAWSVEATTIPSLQGMLHLRNEEPSPLHILALARAAGFKVWWIGNQDDVAIENLHAKLADEVELVNRTPGRASASPDTAVLAPMRAAMADPSPRKLIVVHLIGAHPHYLLRFPKGANPFDHADDAVDQAMREQGRAAWVREFRQDYDAALLNHDSVMAELLTTCQKGAKPKEYRAWMFLSDHGQEVGHVMNHAGHSQSTPAGYRIPAFIWQNTPRHALPAGVSERPFRADWASMTLAGLMDIRWDGYQPSQDVLNAGYQWQAPTLGTPIKSFVD